MNGPDRVEQTGWIPMLPLLGDGRVRRIQPMSASSDLASDEHSTSGHSFRSGTSEPEEQAPNEPTPDAAKPYTQLHRRIVSVESIELTLREHMDANAVEMDPH
jgi:hypothetical protein